METNIINEKKQRVTNVNFTNVQRIYKADAKSLNRLYRDLSDQQETCEDTKKMLAIIFNGARSNSSKKMAFVSFCKKYSTYKDNEGNIMGLRKVSGYKEIKRAYKEDKFTFAMFKKCWYNYQRDYNDVYQPVILVYNTFYSAKLTPMTIQHALNIHRLTQREIVRKKVANKDTTKAIAQLQAQIEELKGSLV